MTALRRRDGARHRNDCGVGLRRKGRGLLGREAEGINQARTGACRVGQASWIEGPGEEAVIDSRDRQGGAEVGETTRRSAVLARRAGWEIRDGGRGTPRAGPGHLERAWAGVFDSLVFLAEHVAVAGERLVEFGDDWRDRDPGGGEGDEPSRRGASGAREGGPATQHAGWTPEYGNTWGRDRRGGDRDRSSSIADGRSGVHR
jgi:hypothetical protein